MTSRLLETIAVPKAWPGGPGRPWGKLTPGQIAQRSGWRSLAASRRDVFMAGMHSVTTVPINGVHTTFVNPMDPATVEDTTGSDWEPGYRIPPGHHGRLHKVGR